MQKFHSGLVYFAITMPELYTVPEDNNLDKQDIYNKIKRRAQAILLVKTTVKITNYHSDINFGVESSFLSKV